MGDVLLDVGITISVIYLIVGIADFIFEYVKFKNDMKMSKQELKDEWKDTEGNPEVKNQQKRRMNEASRRRMMQAVPEADVVITNPTHFAVALKYEQNSGKAPVVVAKGEDYLAQKLKRLQGKIRLKSLKTNLLQGCSTIMLTWAVRFRRNCIRQ